jgi:hypothetical protein
MSHNQTCPTKRLPADELDAALLEALLATYQRTDLFQLAVQAAATRLDRVRQQHQDELHVVQAELRRTEEAVQRYLLAFEAGTLADTDLAPRVHTLTAKTAELQHRQADLTAAIGQITAQPPGQATLAHLRERIHQAVTRRHPRAHAGQKKRWYRHWSTRSASKAATPSSQPSASPPPAKTRRFVHCPDWWA